MVRLLLLSFFISNMALAGNGTSGGGDNKSLDTDAAWFAVPSRAVTYCIEQDSSFPVSETKVKETIEKTFQTWSTYLLEKTKNANRAKPLQSTHLIFEGTCHDSTDLVFYLGLENNHIKNAKRKFDNPSSMAIRTQYNPTIGWGKGYIWLAKQSSIFPKDGFPNWEKDNQLTGFLLHELGHVFGVPHVPGSIMEENISQEIKSLGENFEAKLEFSSEIITADNQKTIYRNTDLSGAKEYYANLFFQITGKSPAGEVKSILEVEWSGDNQLKSLSWVLKDEQAEHRYLMQIDGNTSSLFNLSMDMFKTYTSSGTNGRYHISSVIDGTITLENGKKMAVSFLHNTNEIAIFKGVLKNKMSLLFMQQ